MPARRAAGIRTMRSGPHQRPWAGQLLVAALSLLVSFALVEVATRWFFPLRRYVPRVYVHGDSVWPWCQPFEHSRFLPSRFMPGERSQFLLPNHDFAHEYPDNSRGYFDANNRISYHNNNFGFRGPDLTPGDAERRDDRVQIALLGDSFTFGEGVKLEDTYGRLLETALEPRLRPLAVEVVNLAQPGFNTVNEVDCWLEFGRLVRPDVVLLAFSPNDVLLSRLQQDQHRELTGQYLRMFAEPSGIERYLQVVRLVRLVLTRQAVDAQMRRVTVQDLHTPDRGGFSSWDLCTRGLTRLRDEVLAAGGRFVIVILPLLDGLDGAYPFDAIHDAVRAVGAAGGVPVIDLLPVFRGARDADLWVHPVDHHPNEVAHRMIADGILTSANFQSLIEAIRAQKRGGSG